MGTGLPFGMMKKYSGGCTTLWMHEMLLIIHFKMVKRMLSEFDSIFKIFWLSKVTYYYLLPFLPHIFLFCLLLILPKAIALITAEIKCSSLQPDWQNTILSFRTIDCLLNQWKIWKGKSYDLQSSLRGVCAFTWSRHRTVSSWMGD